MTANELHVPVSDPAHPTPTFITLLSADTDHSFWVPRLAGKTDLIPNRMNNTWIDPHETGLYLGQCAQYCGTQHAKMLLRVYVQPRADFDRWVQAATAAGASRVTAVAEGRHVFETTACINCHTVSGTQRQRPLRSGSDAPDEPRHHRSGAAPNTPENLRPWIRHPDAIKPGSRMPAMKLSERDIEASPRIWRHFADRLSKARCRLAQSHLTAASPAASARHSWTGSTNG